VELNSAVDGQVTSSTVINVSTNVRWWQVDLSYCTRCILN